MIRLLKTSSNNLDIKKWQWASDSPAFFFACMVLAIVFRVYLAFSTTFWLDELWSSYFSEPTNTLKQVIDFTLSDVHPPLYQILLHYWFMVFGFTEGSARSLSLVFGILAIPCFYRLSQTLYEERIARIATMIFALNLTAACFTAEVRSYELLLLLSIVSTYFFAAYMLKRQGIFLAGYFLSALAIMYTHYFGLVLLFTHGVTLLLLMAKKAEYRKVFWPLLLVYVLLLLSFLPMIGAVIENMGRETFWIKNPGLLQLSSYVFIYFGGPFALPLFLVIGIIVFRERQVFRLQEYLLILAILLILLVPYWAGFFINPITTARNAMIAVPYLCLLLAYPVAKTSELLRKIFLLISLGLVVGGFILVPVYKGEDIDRVLTEVAKTDVPFYLVNADYLPTDDFLRTKIAMNPKQYADLQVLVMQKDAVMTAGSFWLACYHTCYKVSLSAYMKENYTVKKRITGRGVESLLIEVN